MKAASTRGGVATHSYGLRGLARAAVVGTFLVQPGPGLSVLSWSPVSGVWIRRRSDRRVRPSGYRD